MIKKRFIFLFFRQKVLLLVLVFYLNGADKPFFRLLAYILKALFRVFFI